MASVTIPGTGGSTISETFGNTANLKLATQIRDALVLASNQNPSLLNVTTTASLNVPGPPANPGGINELVITKGGDYTIPAGSAGAPDYVVVLDSLAPVTIHGSPNTSILGGLANVTIIDPADITLSEQNGNAQVTVTGTGDRVAGNNLNDTLTAAGVAGSISGGTGTNVFFDLGSNDTISAQGFRDTIFGGSGKLTIQIASTVGGRELVVGDDGALFVADATAAINAAGGDTIFGGGGTLNVTTSGTSALVVETGGGGTKAVDTGTSDTIVGGGGSAAVTLTGGSAFVVGGANLTVIDNGTSDTIVAGSGNTSVTAATSGSFVRGGAGSLTFVGGTGESTIFGGSRDATVFGSTGATSLFGSAGSEMTYVNTTAGGLSFTGGKGSETLDASLSKAGAVIIGGHDTAGHNVLIGGAGADTIDAGSGAGTLVGGGGANIFNFFPALGGPSANFVISDFSAIDTALLVGYKVGTAANAIAAAQTANGSTTVTLSDNTKITFTGITDPDALNGHFHVS